MKLCDLTRAPQVSVADANASSVAANPLNLPLLEEDIVTDQVSVYPSGWPPGTVVNIHFSGGSPTDHAFVLKVAENWERQINLMFLSDPRQPADIRIAFDPNAGNWSMIGTVSRNRARDGMVTMNLADRDASGRIDESVILHELGHAIGLLHEHQHPANTIAWNTTSVVTDLGRLGWSREKVDDQVFRRLSPRGKWIEPYDPYSIMHYPVPAHWITSGAPIGPNYSLSSRDIAAAQRLYPNLRLYPLAGTGVVVEGRGTGLGQETIFALDLAAAGRYEVELFGTGEVAAAVFLGPDHALRLASGRGLGRSSFTIDAPAGLHLLRVRDDGAGARIAAMCRAQDVPMTLDNTDVPLDATAVHTFKLMTGDKAELVAASITAGSDFFLTFGDPFQPMGHRLMYSGEHLDLTAVLPPGRNQVNLRHRRNEGNWVIEYRLYINGAEVPQSPFTGSGHAWWLSRFHAIADLVFLKKN